MTTQLPVLRTKPRKGARRLTVDGEQWWFFIGTSHTVLWDPGGRKHLAHTAEVGGRSQPVLERGQWKHTSDGMITPEHVRRYVRVLKKRFTPVVDISIQGQIEVRYLKACWARDDAWRHLKNSKIRGVDTTRNPWRRNHGEVEWGWRAKLIAAREKHL